MAKKMCFVIGLIGEQGSKERDIADWLLEYIVKPVLKDEYDVYRADEITSPGLITDQVITSVENADLVVADLTGSNANAFYELAIRHMSELPVIHMINDGGKIPFDTKDYRTISYKLDNPRDVDQAKESLRKQLDEITDPGYHVSNPITKARGHRQLQQSGDTKDQLIGAIVERMSTLEVDYDSLKKKVENMSGVPKMSLFGLSDVRSGSNLGLLSVGNPYSSDSIMRDKIEESNIATQESSDRLAGLKLKLEEIKRRKK